jgi:membrane fusion protein, multidrug efflux system
MNDMTKIAVDTATEIKSTRKKLVWMFSLPLLILAVAAYFWLTSGKTVSTDNAMVGAPVVTISPEITGRIVEVLVKENQAVKPGDLLFRIDPRPYQIALMQAQAALGSARVSVNEMTGMAASKSADVATKTADIGARQSAVVLARENYARQTALMKRGFTTKARVDEANATLIAAQQGATAAYAQRVATSASADAARAMLGTGGAGGHPQVLAAMAQIEKARLDLSRTEIRSPIAGIVTQTDRLQPGNMSMQALAALSIVGSGDAWIEANFKETQLAKVRPGQRATVELDAIPGRKFKAQVIGIGAGTGSEFSLLPAQNATGNWVKVTQRVPVRLRLIDTPDRPLVAGWSANVTVRVAD